MSRRHRAEKRQVLPDAQYGDQVITRFMNQVMYQGKKSAAEQIVHMMFPFGRRDLAAAGAGYNGGASRAQGRPHPFPRFLYRRIGQAHHLQPGQAGTDVYLNPNGDRLHPPQGAAVAVGQGHGEKSLWLVSATPCTSRHHGRNGSLDRVMAVA